MSFRWKQIILAAVFAAVTSPAFAAGPLDCGTTATPPGVIKGSDGAGGCYDVQVDSSHNLKIVGSISASLAGFTPTAGATANVSNVVNVSQDVALPAGTDAVVTNKGLVDVNFRVQLGAGTAVSTDQTLKAGAAVGIHNGTATHLSVIAPTGTGTGTTAGQLNIQGGAGLAAGYGGSASSGGGAVTAASGAYASGSIASGAMVDLGTTADAACGTDNGTCTAIALIKRGNQNSTTLNTTAAAAVAAGTNRIGYITDDPCGQLTKLGAPINLTASGQLITGTAAKKTYICSIDLVSATAQNIALVEGTGSVCATNIFGLAGGTTAATGWNYSANGGLSKGSGVGTVYSPSADSNGTAANVCLLLSSTGQTSGQITYVQQ